VTAHSHPYSPKGSKKLLEWIEGTRTCVFFLSSDVCMSTGKGISLSLYHIFSLHISRITTSNPPLPFPPSHTPSTLAPSLPSHTQTNPTCLKTGLRSPPPHRLDLHPLLLGHRQPSPLLPIHKPNLRSPLRHVLFQPHARRKT
jgi:hypothetical protein